MIFIHWIKCKALINLFTYQDKMLMQKEIAKKQSWALTIFFHLYLSLI